MWGIRKRYEEKDGYPVDWYDYAMNHQKTHGNYHPISIFERVMGNSVDKWGIHWGHIILYNILAVLLLEIITFFMR